MITAIIIDDDTEFIYGFESFISWKEHGYEIIGKFNNSQTALEFIRTITPDVIITDISMPFISGLEIIREAKKLCPDLKTIILTCYEDFNYAQEAIHLKADNYMVKHLITPENLIEVLEKVKYDIVTARENTAQMDQIKIGLEQNKIVLKNSLFDDFINRDAADIAKLIEKAKATGIKLPSDSYLVIGIFIDNPQSLTLKSSGERKFLFNAIQSQIEEHFANEVYRESFSYSDDFYIILDETNGHSLCNCKTMIQSFFDSVDHPELKLSACISSPYKGIENLSTAVKDLFALRKNYFYTNSGSILFQGKAEAVFSEALIGQSYIGEFRNLLEMKDAFKLENFSEHIRMDFENQKFEPDLVKGFFRRLFVEIEAFLLKNNIKSSLGFHEGYTFDEYLNILDENIFDAINKTNTGASKFLREDMKRVLQYIELHLDEHINCEIMSRKVHLNRSYFSRLFKNETKYSFSDYIVRKRIDKATELLENSDFTIEEISNLVGIETVSYFYRVYKKLTGRNPGDLRKK